MTSPFAGPLHDEPALNSRPETRILLVDDDEQLLDHLRRFIADAGYQVLTAPDSSAALDLMQRDFSPIVIVDVNMPGIDGLGLCRAIRRRTYSGYTYLILHSVDDTEEAIIAGLDAGADDYVSKRTSRSQLIGRLRAAQRILSLEHSLRTALEDREQEARTDYLTGAFNRRYLFRQLTHELSTAHRLHRELSVLVLDLDHFSEVNDRYGHAAGDGALKEVVHRIHQTLRRNCDWCARLGGDEFAVVLPRTDIAGARFMAERLRSAIEAAPIRTGTGIVRMTVSIGASGFDAVGDREDTSAEALLDLADQSLYASKSSGRNQVTVLARTRNVGSQQSG